MSTLHLGTHDVPALLALLPDDVEVFAEGDSWEIWGEFFGTDADVKEGYAKHVVIRGKSLAEYLTDVGYIMTEAPGLLVAMKEPAYQAGTLACVTDDKDWSEALFTLVDKTEHRAAQRPLDDKRHRAFAAIDRGLKYLKYGIED